MSSRILLLNGEIMTEAAASVADKVILGLLLLAMSGLFFLSDDHRYGVVFFQESLAAVSIASFLYILAMRRHLLGNIDWSVLLLALLVFFIPILSSYLYFAQPFQFGVLEERRSLLYFSSFLAMLVLGGRHYTSIDIEKVLKIVFWVALIWATLNAFDLVPRHQGFSFSVHKEQFAEGFQSLDERFETRFINGSIIVFLYPFFLLARKQYLKALLPVVLLVLYMVFINQTRSLAALGVLMLVFIGLMRGRKEFNLMLMVAVPVFFLCAYFLYYLYSFLFGEPVAFYDMYRNMEFRLVFNKVIADWFIPHGHLSLQFDGGFKQYFGINIYTYDIGLAGNLYKYGFVYLFLFAIFLYAVLAIYRQHRNEFSIILAAMFVSSCFMMPFYGEFGRMGIEFSVLLVLARIRGNQYETGKYIACVRRGGASGPSYPPYGANAVA